MLKMLQMSVRLPAARLVVPLDFCSSKAPVVRDDSLQPEKPWRVKLFQLAGRIDLALLVIWIRSMLAPPQLILASPVVMSRSTSNWLAPGAAATDPAMEVAAAAEHADTFPHHPPRLTPPPLP